MRFKSALLFGAAVAALALVHTAPVSAATGKNPVYGVGGTLPDQVYRSLFDCVGEDGHLAPHSAIDVLAVPSICTETAPVSGVGVMEILYAGIGTGSGQSDYLTNTTLFGATPSNRGVIFGLAGYTIGGYQDPFSGYAYPYAALHFAAGSAPLTADQLAQTSISGQPVVVGAGNVTGPAIQVPSLVTTVALAVDTFPLDGLAGLPIPTDGQGTRGTSGLVLSQEQLCGIYNGDIKDWNDPALTQSNGLTPSSTSRPIIVAYRHDSAGTTFLMSNALITQCAGTAHPMNPAWGPASLTYFLDASPKPATWVDEYILTTPVVGHNPPETGDEGMADSISSNGRTIAYISPSFAQPYGGANASPTANLVNSSGIVVPPTPYSASLIVAGLPAPNPGDDAVTWGTKGINPNPSNMFAYPIGGFSWVYLYTCYASLTDFIDIASGSQPGTWGWYFGEAAQHDVTANLNKNEFARIPNSWLRAVRNLLFSDPATKIRVGPSAGVCIGGAG